MTKDQDPQPQPEIRYIPVAPEHYPYKDDEDEIDLLALIKKIWDGRFIILKTVVVFMVLGLIVALGSPEMYTSEVKLLPEQQQQSSLGGLGGLARQFGVTGGAQRSMDGIGIPPNIYPSITQSTVFLQRLKQHEVTLPDGAGRVILQDYLMEHQEGSWLSTLQKYTIGLPITILRGIRTFFSAEDEIVEVVVRTPDESSSANRIISMSREEWENIRKLREMISTSENRDTGVMTVSVIMGDAQIAAEVAHHVVELLKEYITNYRTEKARLDVEFIEERYSEARERFEAANEELARFHDENRGQLTAMARTRVQEIQSRYNLAFNLYNTMAERLEEARIKLQEDTPVVNIMEPAAVPDQRSEPKRGRLMAIYTLLGGILGIGLIFTRQGWIDLRSKGLFES